jgi:hypothetical protein
LVLSTEGESLVVSFQQGGKLLQDLLLSHL